MTTPKKLIEFLDDIIRQSNRRFTEIKEILEQQSQPSEDLVEKMIEMIDGEVPIPEWDTRAKIKDNIRTLLQRGTKSVGTEELNPWFCPECGSEYNSCCKEQFEKVQQVRKKLSGKGKGGK